MNLYTDKFIPEDILELCTKNVINLSIRFSSNTNSANTKVKIKVGENTVFTGVLNDQEIVYKEDMQGQTHTQVSIEIFDKTDDNECIQISQFVLNDVDIIKTGFIYRGTYNMNLGPKKKLYYTKNNLLTTNITEYKFYENCVWTLNLQLPVLSYINKLTNFQEDYDKIDYRQDLIHIFKKLEGKK